MFNIVTMNRMYATLKSLALSSGSCLSKHFYLPIPFHPHLILFLSRFCTIVSSILFSFSSKLPPPLLLTREKKNKGKKNVLHQAERIIFVTGTFAYPDMSSSDPIQALLSHSTITPAYYKILLSEKHQQSLSSILFSSDVRLLQKSGTILLSFFVYVINFVFLFCNVKSAEFHHNSSLLLKPFQNIFLRLLQTAWLVYESILLTGTYSQPMTSI